MAIPSFINTDLETWLKKFKYSTAFKTRFSETDAFGHINNVSYFGYFEQARLDYFEYLNLLKELSISKTEPPNENLIVSANLECHYLLQLYYGQDINIFVRTSKIGSSSFELEYCLLEEKKQVAAIGRGSIVYINKKSGKATPLPETIKEKISSFENTHG